MVKHLNRISAWLIVLCVCVASILPVFYVGRIEIENRFVHNLRSADAEVLFENAIVANGRSIRTWGDYPKKGRWLGRFLPGEVLWIDLTKCKLNPQQLDSIFDMSRPRISCLMMAGMDLADHKIDFITSIDALDMLDLSSSRITGGSLARIATFLNLQELYLQDTAVDDADLCVLSSQTQLRVLVLSGTNVSEDGVALLRSQIPNCSVVKDR
jgi:hypothetical protein